MSIFERLLVKHYSVLDKINLNCSVTETTFRRNFFYLLSYSDKKDSLQHLIPCPSGIQVVLTIPQHVGGVQKELDMGTYDNKDIKM